MERASAEQWAQRVERWKDSGLTAKEFAAETGLKASTLSYWRWKLGASSKGAGESSGPRERRRNAISKAPVFGESEQFVELPAAVLTASSEPTLELVLGGEVRVRVPIGFDEATLTRVVRAVGASR